MQTYKIEFEKVAQKFLDKQNKKQRIRIYKAIYKLPVGTDIKKIKGHNLLRMRIGDYRIIYAIEKTTKTITIKNIDNRGDVYKKY